LANRLGILLTAGVIIVAGLGGYVWLQYRGAPAEAKKTEASRNSDDQGSGTGTRRNRRALGAGVIPVLAATVKSGDLSVSLDALGTVTPLASVIVRPQLSGYLTDVNFTEGETVKRGDFLAQIDPRPYQIALEQAQGALARDQATLKNALLDLARFQKLNAQNSIARQQLDTQQSLVQQLQGTITTDKAAVDTAKLNLDYCHITAPVGGRVGLRQVDPGNYVTAGDATGLVVINQIQPITVIFTIPEDDIPMVQKQVLAGDKLQVVAADRAGVTKLATGTLATLDNQIDTTTGTVKLRAQFENDDLALFPNQFVNVTLQVRTEHAAAIVPVGAIQHGSSGDYVYRVKDGSSVAVQSVKTGVTSGDDIEVLAGLAAGDQVVVDGVDQLKDGTKVSVTDAARKLEAQAGGQK